MKINSYELDGRLRQKTDGVYVLSGDDPFWLDDAAARIRRAARASGFAGCAESVFSDEDPKTDELIANLTSPGLFADRSLAEVRIRDLRGRGRKILEICLASLNPSLLLILRIPRITLSELKSNQTLRKLADAGIITIFYDPDERQIRDFLRRRAQSLGLGLTPAALALLCGSCEGNMEAMTQIIEKMALCGLKGTVDDEVMREHVSADARFSGFDYTEALIDPAAPPAKRLKILGTLRRNGAQLPELVALTGSALGTLRDMRAALDATGSLDEYFAGHRLLKSYTAKRPVYARGAANCTAAELRRLIGLLTEADFLARSFRDEEALMILREIAAALTLKDFGMSADA